jgi:aldose sugar dehydrogenase
MKYKNIGITIIIILIIIISFIFLSNLNITEKNESIEYETIVEDLDTPWAIDFLPDGNMIFTERSGNVNLIDLEEKEREIIAKILVTEISESGLAGIAVDPDFEENNFIYLYYTYEGSDDIWNRVSRFVFESGRLKNEEILLDKIPAARFHDGGRIKFGPDEKLYITTGDATLPSSAQDLNSVSGKILRMDKDTTIPSGNPFGSYVYSYGHRNPQGIDWGENVMYAAEHGPTRKDEVNIIELGKNYGWPTTCDEPSNFEAPIRCYEEFTLAPGGIAYHENSIYVAGLRGAQVRKLSLADDGRTVINEEEFISDLGRIRDVVVHGNFLYIATSNRDGRGFPKVNDDKIIRVRLI